MISSVTCVTLKKKMLAQKVVLQMIAWNVKRLVNMMILYEMNDEKSSENDLLKRNLFEVERERE